MSLELRGQGSGARTACCGRLFIVHQPDPPTVDSATKECAAALEFGIGWDSVALLFIVERISPVVPPQVRAVYRRAKQLGPPMQAWAGVVGDSGSGSLARPLAMSAAREVLAGDPAVPVRVFDELEAAVGWLATTCDLRASPREVLRVAMQLRNRPHTD